MATKPRLMDADAPALVLNFDDAGAAPDGAVEIAMPSWQESVRFGCRWSDFRRMSRVLEQQMPARYGCVFTGSGDYHHLSLFLLRQLPAGQRIQLIVCDNHPDNMRYPWGIHCGSWVYHASRLPQVEKIHVIGISSADITLRHAWENHLSPLFSGKLHYWSVGVDCRWPLYLGAGGSVHTFSHPDALLDAFLPLCRATPVYLSLDKDVLSPHEVRTNWDQGQFTLGHLQRTIAACAGNLVGMDVTGEVSSYDYRHWFKRWLSGLDGQQTLNRQQIAAWQSQHRLVNQQLLAACRMACSGQGSA